jgi:pyrroline-5-carboxylate reductase
MKILIIGGGNMGLTFANAFINSQVVTIENLIILEKDKEDRIAKLKSLEIGIIETDIMCIKKAHLIILAVKPQDSKSLFIQIKNTVDESQVVLSIMAGVSIETIKQGLGVNKVVRAMPNLPSQIGLGMTGFIASEEVTRFELGAIQNLLSTTGKTLNVDKEEQINAVTAISGSGPAYVYYFMDSLIGSAQKMGFSRSEAQMLVLQTFSGALTLFQQNRRSCKDWIETVSSKGGTTEAAIDYFNQENLREIIAEATKVAFGRAQKLGE